MLQSHIFLPWDMLAYNSITIPSHLFVKSCEYHWSRRNDLLLNRSTSWKKWNQMNLEGKVDGEHPQEQKRHSLSLQIRKAFYQLKDSQGRNQNKQFGWPCQLLAGPHDRCLRQIQEHYRPFSSTCLRVLLLGKVSTGKIIPGTVCVGPGKQF